MINDILNSVRCVWHTLEIDQPMPNRLNYVLQSRRRVILFLFSPRNTNSPLVVVKINRTPKQNRQLVRYVEQTHQVRGLLDPTMRATIPSMGLLEPINGLGGVVEKALPGHPFETATLGKNQDLVVANGCRAFANWLASFQAATRGNKLEITQGMLETLALDPLENLTGIGHTHRSLVKDITGAVLGLQISPVWAFGDAHPSNILLNNSEVSGIVDWEGIKPNQWPVFDWFQFTLSLAQELIKAQYPSMDRLKKTIMACELLTGLSKTPLATLLQQQTINFFKSVNLDARLTLPFFLVFLIGYYWYDDKKLLIQRILTQLSV